jgi:solute carrier family 10 (sodium/bile acid cotransporter), member 7
MLPSTVQASVAFTSIARGNVAAALCSASASTLIGMVLTPLLAGLLLRVHGGFSMAGLRSIGFELLLPFLAGQALERRIGAFVLRHRAILGCVDRGSVLLMVYTVFSAATIDGLWHALTAGSFAALVVVNAGLLSLMLASTAFSARRLGFSRADEITIVFCGSKKSLISGVAMANVLFTGPTVWLSALPFVGGLLERFVDAKWPGMRSSVIARTRLIDDWVSEALDSGITQLVVLGAG